MHPKNTATRGTCLDRQIRLRCTLCGTDSFGEGSIAIRLPGMAPPRLPGMLCEECLVHVHNDARLATGVELAMLAGAVLADLVPEPTR